MTVRTLLNVVDCPIQLRSGHGPRGFIVPPVKISEHLSEEVTSIVPRGAKLIICSESPDYEYDIDDGIDLPWE